MVSVVPANEASWDDLQAVFGRGAAAKCQCQRIKLGDHDWFRMPVEERAYRLREETDCGHPEAEGTSGMVAKGEGVIFVGGDAAQYARWKPLLESILPKAVHVGRPGQAMVLKLVANLLVALNSAAAAEALNLARASGLDPQIVVDVLSTGAATSRMLEVRGPLMVRGQFPAQMKLDLFMKDLHLIQDAAKTAGASLPLTDIAERLYAAAQSAGHGADDLAVVITELARPTA